MWWSMCFSAFAFCFCCCLVYIALAGGGKELLLYGKGSIDVLVGRALREKEMAKMCNLLFFLFRFGRWLFLLSWKLFVARIIWNKRSDFFFFQFLPTLANPPSLTSPPLLLDNPPQKPQHLLRNLPPLRLQREMPCVHKLHHRPRQVALERFRARREENRIVLAPNRQQGHLR